MNSSESRNGYNYEQKFSLILFISLFIHAVVLTGAVLPDYSSIFELKKKFSGNTAAGRDIIVNINQDNIREIERTTLLSDRDSTAKGHITRERGNRWLNNSLEFRSGKGLGGSGRASARNRPVKVDRKIILNDKSEIALFVKKFMPRSMSGTGRWDRVTIPDKNDITMKNAIYYSNHGMFSYNTAKFKNFKYFKAMKDKIASNWNLPGIANMAFGGYNPVTGNYSTARGWERYMTIPSQKVKLVFIMNRKGDVIDVKIRDSLGNRQLNRSCIDAIRLSKNFGRVPNDIKGEFIVIPFIFGFYAY
jgi:TonB family protein